MSWTETAPPTAGLPFPVLYSALGLDSYILVLVVPQLQSLTLEQVDANKNVTIQKSINFQSDKLPDPANSEKDITFILICIPGFYYQEYYLRSSRKH